MGGALALAFCLLSYSSKAQIQQHNISDDGYVRVPLQFAFPYYGRVFTESYMFSNGVVGFLNPTNSWCCTGFDLRVNNGTPFNFSIMPLQTDLLNYSGRFLTEGTTQYQRYKWENISEFGAPNNLNTFGLEIRPSGYIGMHYEKVNISAWRPVTIGMTGDTTLGEYTQHYHGAGFVSNALTSYITEGTGNICVTNPLASPSCPNYQQAYDDYQCSLDPLYRPFCAGYEQAYFTQQCTINPLYNSQCIGYAQAYFNQQCSISALYDRNCAGYAEAYALANVVPSTNTSTTTVQVAQPQVLVSTTGTVSVDTPVVSNSVVNEVVTRRVEPIAVAQSNTQPESKPEPKKEEKKENSQDQRKQKVAEIKAEIAKSAPEITQIPTSQYKPAEIKDTGFSKLFANSKPIKDNARLNRLLTLQSDRLHKEMIDEQWRR